MMRLVLLVLLGLPGWVARAQVQEVVALTPAARNGLVTAACYQKVELALSLTPAVQAAVRQGQLNPYDPQDVDLTAEVLDAQTGAAAQPPALGYYTERFATDADGQAIGQPLPSAHPWRLRLALSRPGRYCLRLHCQVRGQPVAAPTEANLTLVATPAAATEHGPLRFPPGQPYLEFADGSSFVAVGENLTGYTGVSQFVPTGATATGRYAYPAYTVRAYRQALQALRANGGNWVRIMLTPSTFELEWDDLGTYQAYQGRAQDFDAVLALAERAGVYLQVSALWYAAFLNEPNPDANAEFLGWAHNPYRLLPDTHQPIDAFRLTADSCALNQPAARLMANKLRYLVARWGYSNHLASVEVFNEFDNLGRDPALAPDGFYWSSRPGCAQPNAYYVEQLLIQLTRQVAAWCPRLLLTNSPAAYFAGSRLLADSAVSFVSYHQYSDLQNYSQLDSYVAGFERARYHKPVQLGEYGFVSVWYHARNLADFRNPLWSSAFSGAFGPGLYFWSWGALHHNWGPNSPQGVEYLRPLTRFFAAEDLACQPYQPLRTPLVPESAAPRPCLPSGVGPPECLAPAEANGVWLTSRQDSAVAPPATLRPSDPRLEAYALHHPERVLGWVHQREEYWYNLPHVADPAQKAHYAHPDATGQLPPGDQQARYVSDLRGATLRVPGLLPNTAYRLDWWQTLGAGGPRPGYTRQLQADATGVAELPVPDLTAADATGNAPDYAFKLVRVLPALPPQP